MDNEESNSLKKIGQFKPSEAQLKSKFKLMMPAVSLFGNDWSALKKSCCPLCGRRLKVNFKTLDVYCNRRLHLKPFYMTNDKMLEIIKSL